MSRERVILGIDTSNYTTSVGIISESGELVANIKKLLPVKVGACGLRQSTAVFEHVKNLPTVMKEAEKYLHDKDIIAIGVSSKPRNIEGSYMPCFLTGVSVAKSLGAALNVPVYEFSHQCGHIMAALFSASKEYLADREFCAFHVSGGTTELLSVSSCENGFTTKIVGGTLDLNAGQLIDRVGVKMGFSFPAGSEVEKCALSYKGKPEKRKISCKDTYVNFSGLENICTAMISEGRTKQEVSAFLLRSIAKAITDISLAYIDRNFDLPFVYAGGVMSNSIIREVISNSKIECFFAEPSLSSDNAVGVAHLARRQHFNIR